MRVDYSNHCPNCGRKTASYKFCDDCDRMLRMLPSARSIAMNLLSKTVEKRLGIPAEHSALRLYNR